MSARARATLSVLFLAVPAPAFAQDPPAGVLTPAVKLQQPGTPAPIIPELRSRIPLVGEPVNGFPNWQERVIHEWINRARVDPQADLAGCPSPNCEDNTGGCYTPQPPLIWDANAGRSARYHSAEMGLQSFFAHNSNCTLVSNLNSLYPGSCNGSASCACVGGLSMCNPSCTAWNARIGLFGASASGEIIAAGYSDANSAFYGWLWEPADSTACSFDEANGHRYLILKWNSAVGTGYQSGSGPYVRYYTGDFADSNSPIPKIPSGTHYPQQASSIDFWANWYDTAPPQSAAVNVDGTCHPMTLQRGSASNGAYAALGVTGLGSGCHRYFFTFRDSSGNEVTYPSTGSYGIGTSACNDWDTSRPSSCTSVPGPGFYAVTPCRVLDTRNANGPFGGPPLSGSGAQRTFDVVAASCGIPSSAKSISVNMTVTQTAAAGSLTAYAGNGAPNGTSSINFASGITRANNAIISLATDGTGTIAVENDAAGTVQFILDVNGYFQ
ncbi:MAG TPA: CAP domain-containing protein [Thermoanaerobaculia bacterium]|nr:CAP domain-containing protein [Thermoanaerobaculia bacterium]